MHRPLFLNNVPDGRPAGRELGAGLDCDWLWENTGSAVAAMMAIHTATDRVAGLRRGVS